MDVTSTSTLSGSPARLNAYWAALRQDAPFHGFVLCYLLAGLLITHAAGVPQKFLPHYYSGYVLIVPAAVVAVSLGLGLASLRGPDVMQRWRASLVQGFSPRLVAGLVMFSSAAVLLANFVVVKSTLPDIIPFYADERLMRWDRALFGQDPWRLTQTLLPAEFIPALEKFYFLGWSLELMVSVVLAALFSRLAHVRNQFLWSLALAWILLGNLTAMAFMSAGPILYEQVTGDQEHFSELLAYLKQHAPHHELARTVAVRVLNGELLGSGVAISAFPSMHVSHATLALLLARHLPRPIYWLAGLAWVLVLLGSVQLAWHYAVDGLASIVGTLLIWQGVGWVQQRKKQATLREN